MVTQTRRKVEWTYLCYPCRDDPPKRRQEAAVIANKLLDNRTDTVIFVPHLAFMYLEETLDQPLILRSCLDVLEVVHREGGTLFICGDERTEGMRLEVERAEELGMQMASVPGFVLESWGVGGEEDEVS